MMVKVINKFLLILDYNIRTRFQVGISSAEFQLQTPIDKAYLKEGDRFEILKRNETKRRIW